MNINELPIELLEKILIYTDGVFLARYRTVCKRWYNVITQSNYLWIHRCMLESKANSLKAKENSSPDISWYQIYRNLNMWPHISKQKKKLLNFFRLPSHETETTTADLNQGILVVNSRDYTKLVDVNRPGTKPIIINGKQKCEKIVSTDNVTALLIDTNLLYIQRTVNFNDMKSEALFEDVKVFSLHEEELFYCTRNNIIYRVDLLKKDLEKELCFNFRDTTTVYKTKDNVQHLFVKYVKTGCVDIVLYTEDACIYTYRNNILYSTALVMNFLYRLNYSVVDEHTMIGYLGNLMKITTPGENLVLTFPAIQVAVLYNNHLVFATQNNKIYVLNLVKIFGKYMFEIDENLFDQIGSVPKKCVVKKICITEGCTGPIIMVSTTERIYLYKTNFFPMDKGPRIFENTKLYERLTALRDRLEEKHRADVLAIVRRPTKRKLST
ncbi:uncharacterized protein LOC105392635 isoform X2 [Plutella xylostella]|nr:uncharacterized protein LOC105392635 isoform X2 [Plutella xylostella]